MQKAITYLLCLLLWGIGSTPASSGVLHPGHSGHWYVPERSGEGWVLEILAEDRALVYWFTYDESGNQRWLIGDGEITEDSDGWAIRFPEMLVTEGPRFGADFDPNSLVSDVVGEGVFRFEDCNNGSFKFEGFGEVLSFPVQRLTRAMGADCSGPLHGRPGETVMPYAGQSGSWYDPVTAGQGFSLQWMANGQAVSTWFTYDSEGHQQWMIGVGYKADGQLIFPEIISPGGARFGSDFDSEDIKQVSWGRLEFDLDCDGGTAHYQSWLPGIQDGELSLVRLTSLMFPDTCPTLPAALTELYELDYRELPVMNQDEEPRTSVMDVARDGTVVGNHPGPFGTSTIFRVLGPEQSQWMDIEEDGFGTKAVLSRDGKSVSFNVLDGRTDSGSAEFVVKVWREGMESGPLPGQNLASSFVLGGSPDAACLVGTGSVEPGPHLRSWKWSSESGQRLLPEVGPAGGGTPMGCSEDGNIIIGNRLLGENGTREDIAIRWLGDKQPTYLYDSQGARLRFAQACSANCNVVVGGDQVELDSEHPHFREPWLWTEEIGAHYLGMPEDAYLTGIAPVVAWDVSQDGSFVVGGYAVLNPWDGWVGSRGFIWTQRTGQVLVSELLAETDLGDDNWQRIDAKSVVEGDDGIRILLAGEYRDPPDSWSYARRAAILHLVPRDTAWFK